MDPNMETLSELKKIFNSFDEDKSGFIDFKELGNVAAKLGKTIPAEELASIVKKLDTNKDGKISYGEFQYWWTRGMEGKLGEIVFLKAKAMKMTNFLKNKFNAANISLKDHKGSPKPDRYNFKVSFGKQSQDSIKIDAGVYVKGQKQKQLKDRIKDYLPQLTNNAFGVLLKLPSKNPAEAKVALDQLINSIIKNEQMPVQIESVQQNPFVKMKTIVKDKDLLIQMTLEPELLHTVTPMSEPAEQMMNEIGEGFYSFTEFSCSVNSTVEKIIQEPILSNILKGFSVSLNIQANNSALSKIRKLLQKQELELPAFFNLVTLLRSAKLHLKIKSPDQLNQFFKKLGIDQIVGGLPNVKDLLEELSPAIREASLNQFAVALIHKVSQYIYKHIENDVQIFVLGGPVGTGHIRLQGKNISKIHNILFNQI